VRKLILKKLRDNNNALQVAKNISRREWKVNTLNYDKIVRLNSDPCFKREETKRFLIMQVQAENFSE
jgi:hypothetical protein